ncbi:MAG: glycosyltransferase [Candidatus Micrarchaeia archaeon]
MGQNNFSSFTIIIPTLNEEKNIAKLLSLLTRSYKGVHIIVSDDGSTDNTRKEVLKAESQNSNIALFEHDKYMEHGLTASIVDASLKVNTDYIIVMDGDLQHPPELVKSIAKRMRKSDLCIGTRTEVKNWGIYRKLLSKSISYFVYFVFKLRGKPTCSDMMSGFFGIRANLLKKLAKERREEFVLGGYKVLLDILRMLDKKTKISEVRYATFHPRVVGKSKLRIRHMLEVLVSAFRA